MENDIAQIIIPALAPAVAGVALKQTIDEYKVRGHYTQEIHAFLASVAKRSEVVVDQLGSQLTTFLTLPVAE